MAALRILSEHYAAGSEVELLDGGTLGLGLLSRLAASDHVLILDAIQDPGAAPGSLVRITGDEVGRAVRERLSPHQVGVADLLDGLTWLGATPKSLLLLGLVPASLELGYGVTAAVAARLPELAAAAAEEAEQLGFELRLKECHASSLVEASAASDPLGLH